MRITAVALLLLFAVVVPAAAGRWLPGAAWPSRAPGAGVAAWLAGTLSVVFSLMLAGLILAVRRAGDDGPGPGDLVLLLSGGLGEALPGPA